MPFNVKQTRTKKLNNILLSLLTTTITITLLLLCSANTYAITVTDSLNRRVTLAQPAKRIIALAPHIVENIYSAGAGNNIVGAVDYCDYPKAALKIERVGAINSVSLEKIIALKPDLVIVWTTGNGAKVLNQLTRLGLPVYASDPKNFTEIAQSIRDFGVLTGKTNIANTAANQLDKQVNQLTIKYADKSKVPVFYQVWSKPILSLNNKQAIGDVIALCGGTNIFGQAKATVPKVSVESVISLNPTVMIATQKPKDTRFVLDIWKKHPTITAVKQEHLYYIHPDIISRHSARLIQGATQVCEHIDKAR